MEPFQDSEDAHLVFLPRDVWFIVTDFLDLYYKRCRDLVLYGEEVNFCERCEISYCIGCRLDKCDGCPWRYPDRYCCPDCDKRIPVENLIENRIERLNIKSFGLELA